MSESVNGYVNANPFPERHVDYIRSRIDLLEQYIQVQYNFSQKMDVMLIELTMPSGEVISKTFTTNKSAAAYVDGLLLGYEAGHENGYYVGKSEENQNGEEANSGVVQTAQA